MSLHFAHGNDGAMLADLIAAADAMNHAIPTSGELTLALTRLAKCQVINHVEDRFRIASKDLPSLAEANEKKGSLILPPTRCRHVRSTAPAWMSAQTSFGKNFPSKGRSRKINLGAGKDYRRQRMAATSIGSSSSG